MWRWPDLVRLFARCALTLAWLGFASLHGLAIAGVRFSWANSQQAALLAYVMTLFAVVALPRRQLRDIVGMMIALLTLPEFASAAANHKFDAERWLIELAFVAAALIPLLVERLRRRSTRVDLISFHSWGEGDRPDAARRRTPAGAFRLPDVKDR